MATTREISGRQENKIAKMVKGNLTAGSGSARFTNSDVIVRDIGMNIECKTKMTENAKSFSVKAEWLETTEYQRISQQLQHSALCFSFGTDSDNYFVLSEREFLNYLRLLREELDNESV